MPEAVLIKPEAKINEKQIIEKVKLPCFVKPTDGGSSFGIIKVKTDNGLFPAIKKAFENGSEVIIEENIDGREVTCGI